MKKIFIILLILFYSSVAFGELDLLTNTATRIPVGPLVDPTDGKTAEIALTVSDMTVEIYRKANDGSAVIRTAFNPTASGGSNDMVLVTSSVSGIYDLELTAAQLNWYGDGIILFYDIDGFLVFKIEINVVSANWWNNKYSAAGLSAMSTGMKAEINAEVLDVATETVSELSSPPVANASERAMLKFLYMWARNSLETAGAGASGEVRIAQDNGTIFTEADTTFDGTTFTRGKFGAVD